MNKQLKCYDCLCSADTLSKYDGLELCQLCISNRKSKDNN